MTIVSYLYSFIVT